MAQNNTARTRQSTQVEKPETADPQKEIELLQIKLNLIMI